jgi:hypothetical protein
MVSHSWQVLDSNCCQRKSQRVTTPCVSTVTKYWISNTTILGCPSSSESSERFSPTQVAPKILCTSVDSDSPCRSHYKVAPKIQGGSACMDVPTT